MRFISEKILDTECRYQAHKAFWNLYKIPSSIQPFRFKLKSKINGKFLFIATSEFQPMKKECGFAFRRDSTVFYESNLIQLNVEICPIKSSTINNKKRTCEDKIKCAHEYIQSIGLDHVSDLNLHLSAQEIKEKSIKELPVLSISCICMVTNKEIFNLAYSNGSGKKRSLGYGLIEAEKL